MPATAVWRAGRGGLDDGGRVRGRIGERQVGDDRHAGDAYTEGMQGEGLHDGRHAHAVNAEAREDPGFSHRLVLGASQDRVDALALTHTAQRIRHLGVPHGRHVQEQRAVEGRGAAEVPMVSDRHDVT